MIYKRIALDGQRCIGLGTLIVLQIDFCHSTVKIGLGEKWFGLDYLVEVLDGKDVVLKVKGVATYIEHLRRIDLRQGAMPCQQQGQQPPHSAMCVNCHLPVLLGQKYYKNLKEWKRFASFKKNNEL